MFVFIRGLEQSTASESLNHLWEQERTTENAEKYLDDMPIAVNGMTAVLAEHFKIVSAIERPMSNMPGIPRDDACHRRPKTVLEADHTAGSDSESSG